MSEFRKALLPTLVMRTLLYIIVAILVLLAAGVMTIFFLQITFVLLILVAFYLFLVYTGLASKYRMLYILMKVYIIEKSNKKAALALLDSEIYDHKELLNVEKSEMDVHRLNTRDEADSMRYSKRGERDVRASLGLLTHLQGILVQSMKEDPTSNYDIDLDRY